MSDRQSDLLVQEVDEDLFRERLQGLWLSFRWYILSVAIGIIALVAGNEFYSAYTIQARGEASDVFVAAQKTGEDDIAQAVESWRQAADKLDGSYANLAAMRAAASAYELGDVEGAVAQYEALGSKGDIDPALRDLARLNAGMIAADELGDLVQARSLLSLVSRDGSPYSYSAREIVAIIDMREGKTDAAIQAFQSLSTNQSTPQGIRQRAGQFLAALESAQPLADSADEAPANTPASDDQSGTPGDPGTPGTSGGEGQQ